MSIERHDVFDAFCLLEIGAVGEEDAVPLGASECADIEVEIGGRSESDRCATVGYFEFFVEDSPSGYWFGR